MRLGIISDCIHYKTPDGRIGTENHILLKQIKSLADHYSNTTICCPFGQFDESKVISFYDDNSFQFVPVPQVGGNNFFEKIKLLFAIPRWFSAFKKVGIASDVVYQRFPNNLNIPGFFYFWNKKRKVFATYTGTWKGYESEPATYKLQRWLLEKYFRGPVWVYANENNSLAKKIKSGYSPSYSLEDWNKEASRVQDSIARIEKNGMPNFRMITVGTLIDYKNQEYIVRACKILKELSIPFSLLVVGDGPQKEFLAKLVNELELENEIRFAGKKNETELRELYRQADFVVQTPLNEGFGKVPMEGFFHGTIPIISNTPMALYMVGEKERGFLLDISEPKNLAKLILEIKENIAGLPAMIKKGREFAQNHTLEAWANEYVETVNEYYSN